MKKVLFVISSIILIGLITSACSSNNTGCQLPPMYYDYGYQFDSKSHTERYHNYNLVHESNSSEHKHEFIKFDYRTR